MSSQQAEQTSVEDPNLEKRVAEYLLDNPSFFANNPDVLTRIQVPHLIGGDAVSLIEYQVRVLRKQLESEQHRLTHLISRAREYEALSSRLHGLTLQLMSATDGDHLCSLLGEAMLREFRAEAVTLKLFPVATDAESEQDPVALSFRDFVDKQHAVCGPLDEAKVLALFGEHGAKVKAAALVPIHAEGKSGVLAIGSEDPERFHPDMGTDFLDRLGEIVSHKLRSIHLERCDHS